MRTRMTVIVLGTLLAMAAPAASHSFSSSENPYDNHRDCTGEDNWINKGDDPSLFKTALGLGETGNQDATVYVHTPPRDPDKDAQNPEVGPATLPGVLWIEDNGLDGLQKADFRCQSGAHEEGRDVWVVHDDRVIL